MKNKYFIKLKLLGFPLVSHMCQNMFPTVFMLRWEERRKRSVPRLDSALGFLLLYHSQLCSLMLLQLLLSLWLADNDRSLLLPHVLYYGRTPGDTSAHTHTHTRSLSDFCEYVVLHHIWYQAFRNFWVQLSNQPITWQQIEAPKDLLEFTLNIRVGKEQKKYGD